MKIAVIIAVSEYSTLQALPACKNDATIMKAILDGTGEYNAVHLIDTDTNCTNVISQLTDIVQDIRGVKLDELFFYFTGHGCLHAGEFHFLFSDYDDTKYRQTSLSNEDLDELLRKLDAKLVVKVIDACHSGVSYVKDSSTESSDAVEKSFAKTKNRLQKCHFMFSSEQQQSSWQDDQYSYFTLAFAKAIAEHTEVKIRYQQISAYVADAFDGQNQTPHFVYQGDFLDVFCMITDKLRSDITLLLPTKSMTTSLSQMGDNKEEVTVESSLLDAIRSESESYCTENEVREIFQTLESYLTSFKPEEIIAKLYETEVLLTDNHGGIPNSKSIARWLDKEDHDLFASVRYSEEQYDAEVPVTGSHSSIIANLMRGLEAPTRTVTKTRSVPSNFEVNSQMSFYCALILFKSKFPNIPNWKAFILVFVSKKQIVYFNTLVEMTPVDWENYTVAPDVKWTFTHSNLKPEGNALKDLSAIMFKTEDKILAYLQKRFGVSTLGAEKEIVKTDT